MAALAFPKLELSENATGWGPTTFPAEFVGIPYEDFNKGARLGRVAHALAGSAGKA